MIKQKKVLIFWRDCDNNDAEGLKQLLFKQLFQNITNNHFYEYFDGSSAEMLELASSQNNDFFDNYNNITNPDRLKTFSSIFILAELDWHGHELADFFGLTIAQKLRLNGIICPVFICSFMPYDYLLKEAQCKILGFRGHYFIHLPDSYKENIEISPLYELELLDCKMHYCGIEGAIRDIYHRKQHILSENNLDNAKKQFVSLIEEILKLKGLPDPLAKAAKKIKEEGGKAQTIEELKVLCRADESKLLTYLKDADKESVKNLPNSAIKGNWKVLILEDNPGDIAPFIKALKDSGFSEENILSAKTYDEAVTIINNDKGNKIAVAICDYRLEQERNAKHKQGYSFVVWLSKQDRYTEIFVYSGLARIFLKEVFKKCNVRATVNSKYEVLDTMNGFVEEVIEKGNKIADFVTHSPTSLAWPNIEPFYQQYRQWSGYDSMEHEINETSRNIITQIKYLRETIEKYDLNEKISFSKIPTFPNLSGDLYKEFKKSEVEKNSELLDAFSIENIKLYETNIDEHENKKKKKPEPKYFCFYSITQDKYRDYFKNKLTARRIAWWLIMCEGIHINTVYSILTKGEFINDYFKNPEKFDEWQSTNENSTPETDKAKSLIYTNLAIKREDFPYNLLVEEISWFKYEMNFDLNDLMLILSGFEDYFHRFFETFHSKLNRTCNEYKELESTFICNNNFVFHSANDIRKALELSINCLDNPSDKRDIISKVLNRFDEDDLICLPYFEKLQKYCKTQLIVLKNK